MIENNLDFDCTKSSALSKEDTDTHNEMDSGDDQDVSKASGDSSAEDIASSEWEGKSWKCDLCSARFQSEKKLGEHVKLHGELSFPPAYSGDESAYYVSDSIVQCFRSSQKSRSQMSALSSFFRHRRRDE